MLVTLSKVPSRSPSQISSSMTKPSLGRASWHRLMVIGVKTGEPAFDVQSMLSTCVPMAGSPAAPAAPAGLSVPATRAPLKPTAAAPAARVRKRSMTVSLWFGGAAVRRRNRTGVTTDLTV